MDLSNIDIDKFAEAGAVMELEHPATGDVLLHEGAPITITVLGTDSKTWRNKQREYQRQRIAKMSRSKKNVDLLISDEDACNLLAECTIDWTGIIVDGKAIKFSKDAAVDLYSKYNWIREQVDAFIGDRANFLKTA